MNKDKSPGQPLKAPPKPNACQVLNVDGVKLSDWLAAGGVESKFYAMKMENENPGISMKDAYGICTKPSYMWEWYTTKRANKFWVVGRPALMEGWNDDSSIYNTIKERVCSLQNNDKDGFGVYMSSVFNGDYKTGNLETVFDNLNDADGTDYYNGVRKIAMEVLLSLNPF